VQRTSGLAMPRTPGRSSPPQKMCPRSRGCGSLRLPPRPAPAEQEGGLQLAFVRLASAYNLPSGVQAASRPREGPSPPEIDCKRSRSCTRTSFARASGPGRVRRLVMSARRLPVRPDLDQLKNQAKDLLKALRDGAPEASADFAELHPDLATDRATLADAQLVLARLYGASSWTRLVQCCQLIDAIWDDDPETVRRLVTANRNLLIEDARIVNSNWGPPLSYAANLGRNRIIRLLHDLGARDLQHAMGRAVLQSQIETAAMLNEMLGNPAPPPWA